VLYILLFAGYFEAGGAASLACRHLSPLFGLLLLAGAVVAASRLWAAGAFFGLAFFSSLLAAVGIFTDPHMQDRIVNPLWEFAWPMLREGVGPGNLLGLPDGVASAVALALVCLLFVLLATAHGLFQAANRKVGMAAGGVALAAVLLYAAFVPHLPGTEPGLLHQMRGNHFTLRGEHGRAVAEYEAAFSQRQDPWILYYLARAYLRMGDEAQAELVLEKLMAIDPTILRQPPKEGILDTQQKPETKSGSPTPAAGDGAEDIIGEPTP